MTEEKKPSLLKRMKKALVNEECSCGCCCSNIKIVPKDDEKKK